MDWINQEFVAADRSALLAAQRSMALSKLLPEFIAQVHHDTQDATNKINLELIKRGSSYVVQCDLVDDGAQFLHRTVPDVYVIQVRKNEVVAGKVKGLADTVNAEVTFHLEPSSDFSELNAYTRDCSHLTSSDAIGALLRPFLRAVIAVKP